MLVLCNPLGKIVIVITSCCCIFKHHLNNAVDMVASLLIIAIKLHFCVALINFLLLHIAYCNYNSRHITMLDRSSLCLIPMLITYLITFISKQNTELQSTVFCIFINRQNNTKVEKIKLSRAFIAKEYTRTLIKIK